MEVLHIKENELYHKRVANGNMYSVTVAFAEISVIQCGNLFINGKNIDQGEVPMISVGDDLLIHFDSILNKGTGDSICEIEIDFNQDWVNGSSPLDPRFQYFALDKDGNNIGNYQDYTNDFMELTLTNNTSNPIVLGLVAYKRFQIEYWLEKDGEAVQGGTLFVQHNDVTIEVSEFITNTIAGMDTNPDVSFGADFNSGNARLLVNVADVVNIYKFRYRFFAI